MADRLNDFGLRLPLRFFKDCVAEKRYSKAQLANAAAGRFEQRWSKPYIAFNRKRVSPIASAARTSTSSNCTTGASSSPGNPILISERITRASGLSGNCSAGHRDIRAFGRRHLSSPLDSEAHERGRAHLRRRHRQRGCRRREALKAREDYGGLPKRWFSQHYGQR